MMRDGFVKRFNIRTDDVLALSISKNHEENTASLKITEKNANLLIYQLALAA